MARLSIEQRFWQYVDRNDDDGCWMWHGATSDVGYGVFTVRKGKQVRAHRWAYITTHGEPPPGSHLDHECHNDSTCPGGRHCPHRRCVNPSHLRPVTAGDNIRAGRGLAAVNARKTHCPQGHAYTPENTTTSNGRRKCRTCHRERARRRSAAQ